MCFNKEASIILFFSSIGFSSYLYKIGDNTLKTLAVFVMYIALMQLIEFFLWLNLECNFINQFLSKLIPIYLMGQPLALLLAMYYFNSYDINVKYILFLILLYVVVIFNLIYDTISSKEKPCITTENGTLIWNTLYSKGKRLWNNIDKKFSRLYNLIFCFTPFMVLFLKNKLYSYSSFFLAVISYIFLEFNHKPTYSYWCFFINLIPIILILIRLYK